MRYCLLLLSCFLFACDNTTSASVEDLQSRLTSVEAKISSKPVFHASPDPARAKAPFSEAVQVGNLYFLSGQIGRNPETRQLAEGGIKGETRQCLENIKSVLAQHNLEMKDIVKALVILDDIEDFAAFNEVYREYLPQKPARTTFAAEALAIGANIEIEVVAVGGE